MTEQKLLVGKVATILGDYELAINLGKNSGVKQGTQFAVLGEKAIIDPDSGKKLGTYKYDKTMVRVFQVEENFSVAGTFSMSAFAGIDIGLFPQPKLRSDVPSAILDLDREVTVGDAVEERR